MATACVQMKPPSSIMMMNIKRSMSPVGAYVCGWTRRDLQRESQDGDPLVVIVAVVRVVVVMIRLG